MNFKLGDKVTIVDPLHSYYGEMGVIVGGAEMFMDLVWYTVDLGSCLTQAHEEQLTDRSSDATELGAGNVGNYHPMCRSALPPEFTDLLNSVSESMDNIIKAIDRMEAEAEAVSLGLADVTESTDRLDILRRNVDKRAGGFDYEPTDAPLTLDTALWQTYDEGDIWDYSV